MNLPTIGEIITTKYALELCKHFELNHLIERINKNPENYKEWPFDGVSVANDKFLAALSCVDQNALTIECALPHDLRYGYGESGSKKERKDADLKFKSDLETKAKMNKFWTSILYIIVRIGGMECFGKSYTWAFAQKF